MTYAAYGTASMWLLTQPPTARRKVRGLVKAYAKENRRTGGLRTLSELSMRHGLNADAYGFRKIHDALERVKQPALDALEELDLEGGRDTAELRLYEPAHEFHAYMLPDRW
jgi:hypothetical protein